MKLPQPACCHSGETRPFSTNGTECQSAACKLLRIVIKVAATRTSSDRRIGFLTQGRKGAEENQQPACYFAPRRLCVKLWQTKSACCLGVLAVRDDSRHRHRIAAMGVG